MSTKQRIGLLGFIWFVTVASQVQPIDNTLGYVLFAFAGFFSVLFVTK